MNKQLAWPEYRAVGVTALLSGPALFFGMIVTRGSFPEWPLVALGLWLTLCMYIVLPLWFMMRAYDFATNGPAQRRSVATYRIIEARPEK